VRPCFQNPAQFALVDPRRRTIRADWPLGDQVGLFGVEALLAIDRNAGRALGIRDGHGVSGNAVGQPGQGDTHPPVSLANG
jgi:hypothetical protein